MRLLVVGFVGLVFFRHLQGAVRTFSVVRGERPARQLQLFPLAAFLVVFQGSRSPLYPWLVIPGLIGFAASLALFEWARSTIRGFFFSYAYSKNQPAFLMESGPYAYIRNPFYTSYLLAYFSAAIMFPGWLTLAVVVGMSWFLRSAVRQEEHKFAGSSLSLAYDAYRRKTGRFLPKLFR